MASLKTSKKDLPISQLASKAKSLTVAVINPKSIFLIVFTQSNYNIKNSKKKTIDLCCFFDVFVLKYKVYVSVLFFL